MNNNQVMFTLLGQLLITIILFYEIKYQDCIIGKR